MAKSNPATPSPNPGGSTAHIRTGIPGTHPVAAQAQRDRFGGINWGAAFFGWLSANGLAVILVAIAAAAGTAIGYSQNATTDDAATIGLAGGITLIVLMAIAYFAGGYVAGRMSRFDGPRQGLAVWLWGIIIAIVLAVAGLILGAEYNVLAQLNLPRIPIDEGTATTAGIIALVALLVVTLVSAALGGKAGERYHKKVDRTGANAVEADTL